MTVARINVLEINGDDMNTTNGHDAVVFYWRPGCPFCSMLERNLDRLGIPLDKRNIWDDPKAAAAVRAVAGGNETVPTVVVDDVPLVNPSADQVREVVAQVLPGLVGPNR